MNQMISRLPLAMASPLQRQECQNIVQEAKVGLINDFRWRE